MWHTAVDHSNLQYTPTVATEKCQNTLLYFFTDPFNILGNSLCKISILVWTCFTYRPLDVIWQYVVWYCKVKRVGGGRGTGDVHKMRKNLRGSTVLRTYTEICAVWTLAGKWIVHEDGQYDSVVWRQVGYQISDTVRRFWHTFNNIQFLGYIHLPIDRAIVVFWIPKLIWEFVTWF